MPLELWGQTFPDWDAAHSFVMHKGYSKDQADRIVGKAKSEQEGILETVVQDLHKVINSNFRETSNMERGCLTKLCGMDKESAWKEANKILETTKASPLVRYTVGLALRMTDEHEKKTALEEAEKTMETEDEAKKRETEKKEGTKEVAQTGTSIQSTSTTDVAAGVADRLKGDAAKNAKTEPGTNQYERTDHVVETDGEFDMGACVVKAVADGKTPEEARSHCQKQSEAYMRETVKSQGKKIKYLETEVVPAFMEAIKSFETRLQEAVKPKGVISLERPSVVTLSRKVRETTSDEKSGSIDISTMRDDVASYDKFLDSSRK